MCFYIKTCATYFNIKICADDSRRSPAKFTRESYRLATACVETPFTKHNLYHSILAEPFAGPTFRHNMTEVTAYHNRMCGTSCFDEDITYVYVS